MKQLTQKLKDGQMQIVEASIPRLSGGEVLVQNYYSLISAGTESSTVMAARKNLIGKAKERPQQVKQVISTLKSQGPIQTYRAVMKKLDAHSPLGYSCVGKVISVANDVFRLKVGDYVACGGITASHAEIVAVPVNLCSPVDINSDLKQAAYNTLGAIALQGIRQADLRLGECCAVIGLGLIGQLTCLMLKASGVKVVGVDVNPQMVEMASIHAADKAFNRNDSGIEKKILEFTEGLGCDGVIITAASSSNDPINFSGTIARKKGVVVVVGAVPTGFDREPHFYRKELQVRMSCSYGPGRYDPIYEEKGVDYPPAYVRWTEQRNMLAFQYLIASKKIDANYLTTHVFKLEDAPDAYDILMKKTEPFVGILIEYDAKKQFDLSKTMVKTESFSEFSKQLDINIGFIGAGSYAQSYLIPNMPKEKFIKLRGVVTASSTGSISVAERFGFGFYSGNADDIILNPDINTVFIATRHDTHSDYVNNALKQQKNVFVEKPLCLTENELHIIMGTLEDIRRQNSSTPLLLVGYNRRWSPLTISLLKKIPAGPKSIQYRINAGSIPVESWIQDPDIGGGRIVGEICHFIDYAIFLTESFPVSVYANAMKSTEKTNDTVNISLQFLDGSIAHIGYYANGNKLLPKERIEVYCKDFVGVIDDFKSLTIYSGNRKKSEKLASQDKGQKNMIKEWLDAVHTGKAQPIDNNTLFASSTVTFKIIESIQSGQVLSLINY